MHFANFANFDILILANFDNFIKLKNIHTLNTFSFSFFFHFIETKTFKTQYYLSNGLLYISFIN
jgi:hypothetical protein